ncbi:ammonium transporter [Hominiventricola filiformis]|uniref:Ammonium transporter n=1 Tax=Hominiventricola filiformis TaxID=2885352 RepID=A0AAE3D9Q6_9FIRM|nr:ammonium transporter [Hominiventricola filiformis]MCC2126033.1 ammonium transporter [Hominiventricola filiformis]
MSGEILESVNGIVFGVWFLIGAALVFWMQAGFAMVEAGFTRAKNTGNILMKNLMDFCIGTIVFILIGFGLLLGEDVVGLIGRPGFDIFTSYANFDWSNFVFNLVFCATTATIVSGAMAERTKFLSYCIYSGVISAVIYPIEAHWIWGGGWLSQIGFHDFAGSCAIHMVGGLSALIGAKMLGPRIGKFVKDKSGRITKVNAFPGHNLPLGCLGCFILWLGWYGFNGAAATSVEQLGSIFLTTTVAPATATVVCMIFTWIRYGKPDVSMCLNASLAGLVAITAPCDVTDCFGALVIGTVSGVLVVFGVWFLDYVLRVDDPVGAVAVHFCNGVWGTLAVGLFATTSAPGNDTLTGLFYGGGFQLLGLQILGVVSVCAWTAVTITLTFLMIKATVGLRVSEEEEIVGLDACEHGLPSAYAGFSIMDVSNTMTMDVNENTDLGQDSYVDASEAQKEAAVKVVNTAVAATGIYKVSIISRLSRYDQLKKAMNDIGVTGMTVTQVMGCGVQKGAGEKYRGVEMDATLLPKVKVEVIVGNIPVDKVIEAAKKALYTGHIGDGKIFVYNVDKVVKVRTGEEDLDALKDVE